MYCPQKSRRSLPDALLPVVIRVVCGTFFARAVRCTDYAVVYQSQMSFMIAATIGTLLCLGLAVELASKLLWVPLSSLIVSGFASKTPAYLLGANR